MSSEIIPQKAPPQKAMPAHSTFPAYRTRNEQGIYLRSFADLYEKMAPAGLVPPSAVDFEQSVLGAAMNDYVSARELIRIIGARQPFYRDAHAEIYRAIWELNKRSSGIDMLTVTEQLRKFGTLDTIGGPAYLVELTAGFVTTVYVAEHARVILQTFLARELIRTCEEIKLRAFEGEMDTFALIDHAEQATADLATARRDMAGYYGTTVFRLRDFKVQFDMLYEKGLTPGISTSLKDAFTNGEGKQIYTVQRGTTTLVTGLPGSGKSAVINNITVGLAAGHDWKFGYFSPEMQPLELLSAHLAEIYKGQPFNTGDNTRMSEADKDEAGQFIDEHFSFFVADDLPFSVDAILERATSLVLRDGVTGLVIDPWNHLDNDASQDERGDINLKKNLLKINQFAKRMNCWVCILAHPTKLRNVNGVEPIPTPYDVKGGSEWFDMMDFCISVWRDKKDERKPTQIYVQKNRFRHLGALGVAQASYDKLCGRFAYAGVPATTVIVKDAPTNQQRPPDRPRGARGPQPAPDMEDYGQQESPPYWMNGPDYEL